MRALVLVAMIVVVATPVHAIEAPALRGREAPRATDLLRAEKMAEETRKRLALPRRKSARWVRGGGGWSGRAESTNDERPVVIQVRPPRARASRKAR